VEVPPYRLYHTTILSIVLPPLLRIKAERAPTGCPTPHHKYPLSSQTTNFERSTTRALDHGFASLETPKSLRNTNFLTSFFISILALVPSPPLFFALLLNLLFQSFDDFVELPQRAIRMFEIVWTIEDVNK
jgi:hypothetical protein